jgi:DNA-binding transcriptional LysR family regulator
MESALQWDDLRIALAVATAGSLAGAARSLGVNHTTVLRRLDALEKRLGAQLFVRQRGGYAPTEAGELVVQEARLFAPRVDDIGRRILGRDLALTGHLRLSTNPVGMNYLLPTALAAFARAHAGIEVEAVETVTLADLSKREAELALRIANSVPEHLVGRRLGPARIRVYALRGAPGLPQRVTPLARLIETAPWIAFEKEATYRSFDRWMHAHLLPRQVRLRVDVFNASVAMLKTGIGVALLPTFVELSEPSLVAVSSEIEELRTDIWLLTHPDLRRTARVSLFMQEVGDALAAQLERAR